MRKLIYAINVTLDGCCDHTSCNPSDDLMEYFRQFLLETDLVIYGRKTYDLMIPFWPDVAKNQNFGPADNEYAKTFDTVDRVLVSRTITQVDDPQTTIINNNLKEEILKLKAQPGKPISTGGVELAAELIALGLVDEFRIVVHPIIVGAGRRLFSEANFAEKLGLTLMETKVLPSGCVALHYQKQAG